MRVDDSRQRARRSEAPGREISGERRLHVLESGYSRNVLVTIYEDKVSQAVLDRLSLLATHEVKSWGLSIGDSLKEIHDQLEVVLRDEGVARSGGIFALVLVARRSRKLETVDVMYSGVMSLQGDERGVGSGELIVVLQ